jgi:hypothetical protein
MKTVGLLFSEEQTKKSAPSKTDTEPKKAKEKPVKE